jgi:hypothetical protein
MIRPEWDGRSLNRLITAATTGLQWWVEFRLRWIRQPGDPDGNERIGAGQFRQPQPSTNRIGASDYTYDLNGNMTTMSYGAGSMTLTDDIENGLIQLTILVTLRQICISG